MAFNANEPITMETVKKVLMDHESALLRITRILDDTVNIRMNDNRNSLADLKVFSKRLSFPITETTGRIKFGTPFSAVPAVALTVEQKDPFFVTAVIKSVTSTDVDYAIFYSGNVNVQNYTLNIIAIGQ